MRNGANSSGRILEAALTLFSEKGYDATSTREICQMAGITKPTLYYFFESKEAIYRALVRTAMCDFVSRVDSGLSSAGDLRGKLKKIAESVFEDANRQPRLCRFIFAVVYSLNSPFAEEVNAPYRVMMRKLSAAVVAAEKAGEIRRGDINVRILVLMGTLAEALSNSLVLGSPKLTRKLAHSITDTILDGWLPCRRGAR
jgi:TetR/AcrR family transcriptional regulator